MFYFCIFLMVYNSNCINTVIVDYLGYMLGISKLNHFILNLYVNQ